MSSAFDQCWQQVAPQFDAFFGAPMTYVRGSLSVAITASVVSNGTEADEEQGIIDAWRACTIAITAADLILGGKQVVPAKGDRITRTLPGGQVQHYEVMPPPDSEVYESLDPDEFQLIVYCKQIA